MLNSLTDGDAKRQTQSTRAERPIEDTVGATAPQTHACHVRLQRNRLYDSLALQYQSIAHLKSPMRSIMSAAGAASTDSSPESVKQVSFYDPQAFIAIDDSDHDVDDIAMEEEQDPLAIEPGFVPIHSMTSTAVKRPNGHAKRSQKHKSTAAVTVTHGRPQRSEQTVRGADGKVAGGIENRSPLPLPATPAKPRDRLKISARSGNVHIGKRSPPQQQLLHFKLNRLLGSRSLRKRHLIRLFGAHVFRSTVRLHKLDNLDELLCTPVNEVALMLGSLEAPVQRLASADGDSTSDGAVATI